MPSPVKLKSQRDLFEIQHREVPGPVGLDLESLFVPSSPTLYKTVCTTVDSCAVFDSTFDNPRPPEGLPCELDHAPLSPTPHDPTLIQMFLSDLHSHTLSAPEDSGDLIGMGIFDEGPELESDSGSPSVSSTSPPTTPPALPTLESTPPSSITDPMDDPFLTNFTDISLLQKNCPLLSGGFDIDAPPASPDVNVTVVESSVSSTVSKEQEVFDLSDCVNNLIPTDPLPSSSGSTSSSGPSPSSPATPLCLDDFDFSTISEQDLASVINHLSLPSTSTLGYPSSPDSSVQSLCDTTSREMTPLSDSPLIAKRNRKRKMSADEQPPSDMEELSSEEKKKKIRRNKNNKASQVSRAKRKRRRKDLEVRADELEEENARLRVQVTKITAETEKLKRLLLERLAQ